MALEVYGVASPSCGVPATPVTVNSGQVLRIDGGNFVTNDGSGGHTICGAATQTISGYIEPRNGTETLTADGTYMMSNGLDTIFKIPISSAGNDYSEAVIGQTVDLVVASNIQSAKIGTNTHDLLIIIGGDNDKGFVLVKMNPAEIYVGT